MPVVKIDMWKGRTSSQKQEIIAGVTETFVQQGVSRDQVTVIINEVDKDNWGMNGRLASMVKK